MFNPVTRINKFLKRRAIVRARQSFAKERRDFHVDLSFTEAARRFATRDELYAYMHRYYFSLLPEPLRQHREYFSIEGRGFGEQAFHAMWFLLLREFAPKSLLEIGVFRGQVISLWALIAKLSGTHVDIRCISPFSPVADLVSVYPDLDYLQDTLYNFRHFDLREPVYFRGLSTAPEAVKFLQDVPLDCVYIDGNHDYDVVLLDYKNSLKALKEGGLLIMDDSSLNTDYTAPVFSFAGHPGPSRVAREIADVELEFLGAVGHQNVYRKPPR